MFETNLFGISGMKEYDSITEKSQLEHAEKKLNEIGF